MKAQTTTLILKLVLILSFVTACTKSRDAELPDDEQENVFAISEFDLNEQQPYAIKASGAAKTQEDISSVSALAEKPFVQADLEESEIPGRLQFMFKDLGLNAKGGEKVKVTFAADSKYITAYKVSPLSQLTTLEKQLAVSAKEIRSAIAMRKAINQAKGFSAAQKAFSQAKIEREKMTAQSAETTVLVPLFKYEIKAVGILERIKNELKEETSKLRLRETDFDRATHIKITTLASARQEIGSRTQQELSRLFSMSKIDNRVTSQEQLSSELNIHLIGKFKRPEAKVLSRIGLKSLLLYEIQNESDLTADQLRLLKAGSGNNEIMTCAEAKVESTEPKCVVILRALVPVGFKAAKLELVSEDGAQNNKINLEETTFKNANGLVYIAKDTVAQTVNPSGAFDPQNTLKIADLDGDFLFRRTVEDASNAFLGEIGTSSETYMVNFEIQEKRLVVRSTETLSNYFGQGAKDRQEIMSFDANYFKLIKTDETGAPLAVPQLVKTTKKEAEYVQIDWLRNSIPDASSPLAFYGFGKCIQAVASQDITDARIELEQGKLHFSIQSSMTVQPECSSSLELNSFNFWGNPRQFNFTVKERVAFVKNQKLAEDILGEVSPQTQNALNYNGLTISELKTKEKESYNIDSTKAQKYKVAQHDFRNGKKLIYHVGGLDSADPRRKDILIRTTKKVVDDWNQAFHRAFKGTSLDRPEKETYVEVKFDSEEDRGHLGDLDRSYIWYFDLPFENGALGVAQPSVHPRSAQITNANVLMYPGNMWNELMTFQDITAKQREYEKLLEEIKKEESAKLLATWEKMEKDALAQQEAQKKQLQDAMAKGGPAALAAAAKQAAGDGKAGNYQPAKFSFVDKLLLKAQPKATKNSSTQFDGLKLMARANKKIDLNKARKALSGKVVANIDLNKRDFSKRVVETLFKDELAKDPLRMEMILAREFYNSDPNLSAQAKMLIQQKMQINAIKLKLRDSMLVRYGCRIDASPSDLGTSNDKFLAMKTEDAFEGIMSWVLAHEMGHAFGLIHNFKGSIDKDNYLFEEGEDRPDRTYASVMDYIAYTDSPYRGIGTYDVHAIRAIYTGYVELSKMFQDKDLFVKSVKETAAQLLKQYPDQQQAIQGLVNRMQSQFNAAQKIALNGKYVPVKDVTALMGFPSENYLTKDGVGKSGLLRYFHQCHDGEQGTDVRCKPYDWGSSATEVVKNYVRSYERSYAVSYNIGDRIEFDWSKKVRVLMRTIDRFRSIRGYLDQSIEMEYGKARNDAERVDFINAAYTGLRFFHNVIRTPDTNIGFGYNADPKIFKAQVSQRLYPLLYKKPLLDKNGDIQQDEEGNVILGPKAVEFVEAKPVWDKMLPGSTDRFETIGIGYDKMFALQFLLQASPRSLGDDSGNGFISYLDFEKMRNENYDEPGKLLTIRTISQILAMNLTPGRLTDEGMFVSLEDEAVQNVTSAITQALSKNKQPRLPRLQINRFLLDGAIQNAVLGLNEVHSRGFDPFADYFKVGRSRGGALLTDRPSVRKGNAPVSSQAAVRLWAADNADGSNALISGAALYQKIGDNLEELGTPMAKLALSAIDLHDLSQDPSKKAEVEALEAKMNQEKAAIIKLLAEKLNADGQFDNGEASAEEIMESIVNGTGQNALRLYAALMNIVEQIKKQGKVPVQNLVASLSQAAIVEQLQAEIVESPFGALSQQMALKMLEEKKITVSTAEKDELEASKLMSAIVQPKTVIDAVVDNRAGVIDDMAIMTNLLSSELDK